MANIAWWKRKSQKPWLSSDSVARVKIKGQLVEGHPGIYRGVVFFKRPEGEVSSASPKAFSRIPVSIKTFDFENPRGGVSHANVGEHMRLIEYLRENRVPIPKAGFYQVTSADAAAFKGVANPGEWVFLQQLFQSGGKTKIVPDAPFRKRLREMRRTSEETSSLPPNVLIRRELFRGSPGARADAIKMYTQLANLGIHPDSDIIAPLQVKSSKRSSKRHAIPFDLEHAVPRLEPGDMAELISSVRKKAPVATGDIQDVIFHMTHDRREALRLYEIAKKNASPQLREALKRDEPVLLRRIELEKRLHQQIK